ncbi:MAG: hypothetical protein LBV71_13880 [Prevotella sp.]|jgi:hypothetical protein|nr:hypothetical protein [Prevotella sp.]
MEHKIIRISPTLHAEFKNLVKKHSDLNLSLATEILIKDALKRGEIKESNQTAYKAIKELDQTFRKWMRQQEKTHLSKISEELLALAHELRDTTTKQDLKLQSEKIANAFEKSYEYISKIIIEDYSKTKSELIELKSAIDELSKIIDKKLTKKLLS